MSPRPQAQRKVPKEWHGLLTPRQVEAYIRTGKRPWPRLHHIYGWPENRHPTLAQGISIVTCYGHPNKPEGVSYGLRGNLRDGYANWLRRHRHCGKVPLDFRP